MLDVVVPLRIDNCQSRQFNIFKALGVSVFLKYCDALLLFAAQGLEAKLKSELRRLLENGVDSRRNAVSQ